MTSYFAVATLLFAAAYAYIYVSLARAWPSQARARKRLGMTCAAIVLVLPGAMVLTLRAPAGSAVWAVPLAHVAFFLEGFSLLLLVTLIVRDALGAVARLRRHDPERRRALLKTLNVAAVAMAGGASGVGYAVALAPPRIERLRVAITGGTSGTAPWSLKIAQLSDLHVGPTLRRAYVETVVAQIQSLGADLVVITGDLVDGFVDQLKGELAPLRALHARHGVWFVTGNHEYFYRCDEWLAAIPELGIRVLADAHALLDHDGVRVLLAGVHDPSAGEPSADRGAAIDRAIAGAPPADVRILLAHRPSDAIHAEGRGFDVQLSGHVHAGQFFPMTWLVRATERFVAGLYTVGPMRLYVNRGAGYWGPPNRAGARQEITLLELTGGDA